MTVHTVTVCKAESFSSISVAGGFSQTLCFPSLENKHSYGDDIPVTPVNQERLVLCVNTSKSE